MKECAIAIYFGDNDFITGCEAWLQNLCSSHRAMTRIHKGTRDEARKYIKELFDKSATGIYWLRQNCLEYDSPNIEAYFKIPEKRIFFDEEIQEYLKTNGAWQNSEFFIVSYKWHKDNYVVEDSIYVYHC